VSQLPLDDVEWNTFPRHLGRVSVTLADGSLDWFRVRGASTAGDSGQDIPPDEERESRGWLRGRCSAGADHPVQGFDMCCGGGTDTAGPGPIASYSALAMSAFDGSPGVHELPRNHTWPHTLCFWNVRLNHTTQ
jgi:hypothetical protein